MKKYTLLLLVCSLLIRAYAQESIDLTFTIDEKDYSLPAFLDKENVQSASIYLIDPTGKTYAFQHGHIAGDKSPATNEGTMFQVGSMTLPLIHFALLRLVNDGQINLDAPANQYLKSWKVNKKRFTKSKPVTVRDLILQRRQFSKKYKPRGYEPGRAIPSLLQILEGRAPSQRKAVVLKKDVNESGNSFFDNTLILQQLLEDVHGLPLSEIIQTQVFDALGMHNSVLRQELTLAEKENAVIGYTKAGKAIPGGRWIYPEEAHSGLWCSAKDYALFAQHIFAAVSGKDNRFISQKLAEEGVNIQFSNNGLIFKKWDTVAWGGAAHGFRTQFQGDHTQGWVAVMLTNSHENWMMMNSLQSNCVSFISKAQ